MLQSLLCLALACGCSASGNPDLNLRLTDTMDTLVFPHMPSLDPDDYDGVKAAGAKASRKQHQQPDYGVHVPPCDYRVAPPN
jgi:hypothetical protein